MADIKIAVIIPAAGRGQRFQTSRQSGDALDGISKTEVNLAGRPVFIRSVELFVHRPEVIQVIVAVNPDRITEFRFRWGDRLGFHGVTIVAGGKAERWQTVLMALEAVDERATHVAIHDAVRPLATTALLDRMFEAACRFRAVVPAMPVASTLKRVIPYQEDAATSDPMNAILGAEGGPAIQVKQVVKTVERGDLVEVQTPQVFELELLRRAYAPVAAGQQDTTAITDDAGLVEALGETVYVVEGDPVNLKITRHQDMELAAAIVAGREKDKAATLGKKRLFSDDED